MSSRHFARYAWMTLGLTLVVILWGAFVRATGSGAGCGSHWPLCNGEVIPRSSQIETLIEFTHRLTSGFALIAVILLVIGAFRLYRGWNSITAAACFSLFFMLTEALIGAGLVIFGLVAEDDSIARAWVMTAHLVNTFFLLGALSLTAWWASGHATPSFKHKPKLALLLFALVSLLFLSASGAVAALGDTLYPAETFSEGLRQDFAPDAHFLVQLRIYHPLIAVLVSTLWLSLVLTESRKLSGLRSMARLVVILLLGQLLLGALNVVLAAPTWLQLLHLFLADMIWISAVLFASSVLTTRERAVATNVSYGTMTPVKS